MSKTIGNGSYRIAMPWYIAGERHAVMYGGPYAKKPKGYFGVCLLEHGVNTPNVFLPIPDFKTPQDPDEVQAALLEIGKAMIDRKSVYIGCMGGFGRTGTIMALVGRVFGMGRGSDPVLDLRANYTDHAVETQQQYAYVMGFSSQRINRLRVQLAGYALRRWVQSIFRFSSFA